MKRLLLLLAMLVTLCGQAIAKNTAMHDMNLCHKLGKDTKCMRATKTDNPVWNAVAITTSKAGELKKLLGDSINTIDALTVKGPINDDDYATMWSSSFNGILKEIDLSNAIPESDLLPEQAFFKINEQVDWDAGNLYSIWLEKIILPPSIREFGDFAFAYAASLREIVFPLQLEKIGEAAFSDCINLAYDPFILPNKLKFIGYQAFYNCTALNGEVQLPSSIEVLDGGAFYNTNIKKINFPENLNYLGMFAFYNCNLQGEIILPDNCTLDCRGWQFNNNNQLRKVCLPKNCTIIPEAIFRNCVNLEDVEIPDGITKIESWAFLLCKKLKFIALPEGLKYILEDAFRDCYSIKDLTLPSTLSFIGWQAFDTALNLNSLTSKSVTPPQCDLEPESGKGPFSGINANIPVYIPKGSTQAYASAPGWDYFVNFIEIDFSGIDEVITEDRHKSTTIYDLLGMKVTNPIPGRLYIKNGKKFIQH